jgi:hypothetical protein
MVFSVCVFFGEFLNGWQDILKGILSISVTQIWVCILFWISLVFFSKFLQKNEIELFTASDVSDG